MASCAACLLVAPASARGAQLDASNVGRGSPAQYVKVTGKGFAGEAYGTDLRVRIGEIRLETTGRLSVARYSALGIAVYQSGKILRAAWNHDVRGELTPLNPSATLTGQTFVMSGAGSKCLEAGCEVRLQLRVETGSSDAHAEHTDFAALMVTVPKVIAQPAPAHRKSVQPLPAQLEASAVESARIGESIKQLHGAVLVAEAGRYDQATRLFRETLAFVERHHGPASPMAALVHFQVSRMHQRRKDLKEQERALRRALAIVERHPDGELKRTPGWASDGVDAAMIAADLGYIYWEWRHYDQAYAWYERAHKAAPELSTTDSNRNRRLAVSAAGLMASACMLGKWDVAQRAMVELKERITGVDAELRQWLEYWIRTGEPRLAARKC